MAKEKKIKKDPISKRKGKKYFDSIKKLAKKNYSIDEAISILKDISYTKFDATCELHMNLNSDPKHADQIVRGSIVLPHGSGKSPKIAAFVNEDEVEKARKAGASVAGLENIIEDIKKGKIEFDIAVAKPEVMKNIAKVAKILGQKGLMPNPKSGTVTNDIEKTIKEIKLGKVEFKTDKSGIIHCIFGKISFDKDKLIDNLKDLIKAIIDAKPSGIKGVFINSISISTTMSPGIYLSKEEIK